MQIRRNDYDVTNRVQTTDPKSVERELLRLFRLLYPGASHTIIERAFEDISVLYSGGHPEYNACDTDYHNLQHVLDVTLALARLMDGYERSRVNTPPLGVKLFQFGVVLGLFHDVGYLRKKSDDVAPNGAYYTRTHVSRGANFLRSYLPSLGCPEFSEVGGELLHFTGFEKPVGDIHVEDPLLRLVGSLLGSADLIAQMADRCYLEKCRDRLYPEFVAGGLAIARRPDGVEEVLFTSGDDLVRKTPSFFGSVVHRLDVELGGAYNYAATHFGGFNLYMHAATKNIHFAKQLGSAGSRNGLRREPPAAMPIAQ